MVPPVQKVPMVAGPVRRYVTREYVCSSGQVSPFGIWCIPPSGTSSWKAWVGLTLRSQMKVRLKLGKSEDSGLTISPEQGVSLQSETWMEGFSWKGQIFVLSYVIKSVIIIPIFRLISTVKKSRGWGQVNSTEVLVASSRVRCFGWHTWLEPWYSHTLQSGSLSALLILMMVLGFGLTDIFLPPRETIRWQNVLVGSNNVYQYMFFFRFRKKGRPQKG